MLYTYFFQAGHYMIRKPSRGFSSIKIDSLSSKVHHHVARRSPAKHTTRRNNQLSIAKLLLFLGLVGQQYLASWHKIRKEKGWLEYCGIIIVMRISLDT